MSQPLVPVLTRAGLAELANAQGTGLQATLTQVVVGRGVLTGGVWRGYAPTDLMTGLQSQQASLPILQGQRRDPSGFTILSVLPAASPGEYPINEVGFRLSTGTLFALWSDPVYPLAYKSALADVEMGFDLLLEAIPTSLLAISVMDPDVPDYAGVAAELLAGQARLTTQAMKTEERLQARAI